MSDRSCCAGIHKTKTYKGIVFTLQLALNVADLVADWLLLISVSRLQPGLVYGPLSSDFQLALLFFASIESVLFPFEIFNTALKTFKGKSLVNVDVMSAFVLWSTDVPQIIINVFIAGCREELVSDFQIAKGAVVISGSAIRLLLVIIRYCGKKYLKEIRDKSSKTRSRVAARFLVVIGMIVTSSCVILVFIFSQFHVQNGVMQRYNSYRHFENVGIFVNPNVVYPGENWNRSNLMKVGTMNDVMMTDSSFIVRYRLESGTNSPRVTVAKQLGSESFQVIQCFRLSLSPELNVTRELPVSSCNDVTTANADDTVLLLYYKMPTPSFFTSKHIFGEIYFNVRQSFTKATLPLTNGGIDGPLGYFRYQPTISGQQDLAFPKNYLEDIREVWKTGYFRCESSGSLSPIWDSSFPIADKYFQ